MFQTRLPCGYRYTTWPTQKGRAQYYNDFVGSGRLERDRLAIYQTRLAFHALTSHREAQPVVSFNVLIGYLRV